MKKEDINLYKSPVFDIDDHCEVKELQHTYWSGIEKDVLIGSVKETGVIPDIAQQFYGITSTLLNFALGDAYAGWTGQMAANRDAAADRGHNVHEDVRNTYEMEGLYEPLTLEGSNFRQYAEENGWTILSNEYIVSDDEYFASAIDLLFLDGNGDLCIGDIKTYAESTSKSKRNRTSLQCSIYKWMFGLHNDYQVKHLYEIRLRGEEISVTKLPEVPQYMVTELIDAYLEHKEGYKYSPLPDWFSGLEDQLKTLTNLKEQTEKEIADLKAVIHKMMILDNMTAVKGNLYQVSVCKGRTTTKFDEARFLKEHAEEAEEYMVRQFDQKAYLKAHKKDEIAKEYITETTGEQTLRIVEA